MHTLLTNSSVILGVSPPLQLSQRTTVALRYTRFRFQVQGSRFEAYSGSRLEARGFRLEPYGDSRLLQFKDQGFVSSRLEVEDSRLLTVLFKA